MNGERDRELLNHMYSMYTEIYMYIVHILYLYTCTITCIVHHNLKERKKRTEKKERRITHYKIDNNLNGLEKYSLIFGEQPQRLRKINICNNLIGLEKYSSATTSTA